MLVAAVQLWPPRWWSRNADMPPLEIGERNDHGAVRLHPRDCRQFRNRWPPCSWWRSPVVTHAVGGRAHVKQVADIRVVPTRRSSCRSADWWTCCRR